MEPANRSFTRRYSSPVGSMNAIFWNAQARMPFTSPFAPSGEDVYKRQLRDRWQETAFSNTSQAEPFYTLNVTMGFLPVDRLKEIAARYGASITEYLSAVLLQLSLIHIFRSIRLPR